LIHPTAGADYQALAVEFSTGDIVVPYGAGRELAGRVVTVWPAIGMIDVEFPAGTKRYPVEDMLRLEDGDPAPPQDEYVPGGAGTVSVPGGPFGDALTERVASKFMKSGLYWAAADRRYRATAEEVKSHKFTCPKCKEAALKRAIYRRLKGKSERLYGCPGCLFLIERDSILDGGV
jgi:predicted RNA-binding Zn-ribbon protein involved in translation (DUF1610 family)